jgi:hypothetical protein
MKNILKLKAFLALFLVIGLWSCQKDPNPEINPIAIAEDDFIQITNNQNFVPVIVSTGASKEIDKIVINIIKDGATTPTATNTLKNITNNNLNRVVVNVPFPIPSVAASGKYTVEYTIEGKNGNKDTKSYKVNIQNNQIVGCSGKIEPSSGNNLIVELSLTNPAVAAFNGDAFQDIYITGSFEGWTGGDEGKPQYKFTKVNNNCYYVEVNMPAGAEFKITRGDWPREIKAADGNTPSNFRFNGEKFIKIDVYNWADKPIVTQTPNPPANVTVLPFEAIQTGKTTVVVDVNSGDASPKYYLVKKGATTLDGAIPMFKVESSTKIAGAIPKGSTDEFIVVKDAIANKAVNRYGFQQVLKLSGNANPQSFSGFSSFATTPAFVLGAKIVIVGGATPGDWGVGSGQDFTKTVDGKYQIEINLSANGEYLLLPNYGQWDDKWAFGSGTPEAGIFDNQGNGSNLKAPATAGKYKIEVDFTVGNGSYKLTKLP